MKVIGYTALHYGLDFLPYAIRSIIDAIDEYHVLYTPEGSHGHNSPVRCPERRDDLRDAAIAAAGDKLIWHDGLWSWEGQQRDAIHRLVPDADLVLVLDADEIWADGLAEDAVEYALGTGARNIRLPMIHLWRSFHRGILHDPAYPVRVINPRQKHGEMTMRNGKYISHFGYAQSSAIVRYKMNVHGHKNEFRRDCDWFDQVFMANRQTDCHIVGSQYWNAEPVDPLRYMPQWMQEHPYFNLDVIP